MKKNESHLKYQPEWGARSVEPIPECSIFDLCVNEPAKKYPQKTAIMNYGRNCSYGEIEELTNRFGNALIGLGINKGDRVITLLPNCLQTFIAFYGITKAGAISVPCNVMYKGEELTYQVKDSGAKSIVVLDKLYPVVKSIQDEVKFDNVIVTSLMDYCDAGFYFHEKLRSMLISEKRVIPPGTLDFDKLIKENSAKAPAIHVASKEDPAMILYTSGTTGVPKGAIMTHYNFCSTRMLPSIMGMWEEDVHILVFPMFHVAGYCFHMQGLACGATVIPIALFDPEEMMKLIEKNRVTILFAPPTVFIAMISHPDFTKHDLSSIRIAVGCGGPTPPALQERWGKIVGKPLHNGYGCTETSGTAPGILPMPNRPSPKLGSMGVTNWEIKIVDENGNIVPRRTVGELVHRGPGVAKGYWNKPEETKAQFTEDGWWHSGDAGYMAEDDNIFFEHRIKDLIVCSGYNVSPVEIENILYKHEAVKEVCVYGIPDKYRGESAKALITLKEKYEGKITDKGIIEWCKGQMAAFKVPKVVEFGNIPKTASGKMLRYLLQERDKA
ncbi:MAG: AMP-binding protein [Candidatus Paceibacterota bacterium]